MTRETSDFAARRHFLASSVAGAASLLVPRVTFAAAPSERRLVFIIQRGAADGLHLVPPLGDPDYARQRRELALDPSACQRLDGIFGLHPALVETGRLYSAGQALFVHAVASRYRDRSHFDGQNVIETGGSAPYQLKDGWLNRLAAMLQPQGAPPMAFAPTVPIALRGDAAVTSFAPSRLPQPGDELLARVEMLYRHDEPLHALWSAAMQTRQMAGERTKDQDPAAVARVAATFLARADGPRIAMMETTGWDTHNQQGARLDRLLRGFDAMIAALRDGLGPAWKDTTLLVATEFGRTVAVNGTGGTDHGTASAAMVLGGAVQGGRVIADWPGLSASALFANRDLQPTSSLEALILAVAAQTFTLDPQEVGRRVMGGLAPAATFHGVLRRG